MSIEASPHRSHPDYALGYGDALLAAEPFADFADSIAYCDGYAAGQRACALFRANGFQRDGDGFSIAIPHCPAHAGQ